MGFNSCFYIRGLLVMSEGEWSGDGESTVQIKSWSGFKPSPHQAVELEWRGLERPQFNSLPSDLFLKLP